MIAAIAVGAAALGAGFTGFGFNVMAVPLLALVFLPKDAVLIALLLGCVVSGALAFVAAIRGEVVVKLVTLLTLGSAPGLIAGIYLFREFNGLGLRIFIGVVTALSAILLLLPGSRENRQAGTGAALAVGLLGGTLAATTGTGGPPIVAYVMTTHADGKQVRGTVLAHVALVSFFALVAHALRAQLSYGQIAEALIPASLVGLAVGTYLFRRAPTSAYRPVATLTLLLLSVAGAIVAIR